jgi:hypothetical protein
VPEERNAVSNSPLSVSKHDPLLENLTVGTTALASSACSAVPVAASYTLTVSSSDADASCLP